ncbi:hypothetical protein HMPREF3038_01475 [Akkermansia sp. KLE1797]|nr:hypothetical protein HMPREF3038_01475 [Akkermansia sp. KLE1797]
MVLMDECFPHTGEKISVSAETRIPLRQKKSRLPCWGRLLI